MKSNLLLNSHKEILGPVGFTREREYYQTLREEIIQLLHKLSENRRKYFSNHFSLILIPKPDRGIIRKLRPVFLMKQTPNSLT